MNFRLTRKYGRINKAVLAVLLTSLITSACTEGGESTPQEKEKPLAIEQQEQQLPRIDEQPSTVYYEVFVRSFADSDGDGIGDIRGLIQKLDYLNDGDPKTNSDLGVEGLWLMPIQPSPSYHGYDVTDYLGVNPDYGTIEDLKQLIDEAHKRGIKVIMDLVVNHTSIEHPWFVDAASSPNSAYRDWYKWDESGAPTGTSSASGSDAWHEMNGSHYLAGFWGGMPDLNFDNEKVRTEMIQIGKFWLELGLDGFRIDAAKHIYEDLVTDKGEEVTARNIAWWQEFRQEMLQVNPEVYLVGEIWDTSAAAIAPYLDNAFDSGFNFGLGESILNSVKAEKDNNLAFTLERTYKLFAKQSQEQFVDATFLTNHDQNRVMSELAGNKEHSAMAAAILLTLPGNPFIYYGEEIGMLGVKPDEQIREPMVWSASGGAGQTSWRKPVLSTSETVIPVDEQLNDPESLLSHYRELIQWRTTSRSLAEGDVVSYSTEVEGLMAYIRRTAEEQVLVVHNLSGQEQEMKLNEGETELSFAAILYRNNPKAALNDQVLNVPPYTTVVLK